MPNGRIEINFDNILDVATRGVRRATVFMGLGVNAALDTEFTNYQLTHLTNIQLVPNVAPEAVSHFKDEFKVWIEANGLTELVETFSSFLDSLHHACLVIKKSKENLSPEQLQEQDKNFEQQGFPNKLNILASSFSSGPKHIEYLKSLNKARNCFTHRRGIVGPEDVAAGKSLSAVWLGMDLFAETPTGEKHMLNEIREGGLHLPEGGTVKVHMVERERVFSVGTPLKFSTRDLAEICWFFDQEARSAVASAVEFAKKAGVTVNEKAI
ncbi:MAG: hypothetical protein A3G80_11535 [Betaproteobacteria bacterium RIFCSPLOWO2_12_FULL_62_13b]|nr:MAG: hypothetical protein A3G80_11535 [Betaproteobacteria bacterium RIFCSPLOWO2_12_FULL_62_13b]